MGKSHDLATLKDDGGTFKSSLAIDTGTNGTPNIDFKHANSSADQFRLQAGTPTVTNGGFSIYDIDAAQTRLNIDASGRVTMPYQLHIEGTPNNSGGNGVANAFYTRNTPVGLSFSNSRITAPIAGRYLVCWNTIADNGSGRVDTYIYINGVSVVNSMGESYNNAYRFRGSAHVFNLAANDYIQFYHQDFYAGTSISAWENWNNASVTLLG